MNAYHFSVPEAVEVRCGKPAFPSARQRRNKITADTQRESILTPTIQTITPFVLSEAIC